MDWLFFQPKRNSKQTRFIGRWPCRGCITIFKVRICVRIQITMRTIEFNRTDGTSSCTQCTRSLNGTIDGLRPSGRVSFVNHCAQSGDGRKNKKKNFNSSNHIWCRSRRRCTARRDRTVKRDQPSGVAARGFELIRLKTTAAAVTIQRPHPVGGLRQKKKDKKGRGLGKNVKRRG